MVDVHCHILTGLDDGPEDMDVSLAMAETAIADGITHVVATPHSSNRYDFEYSRVRELREELQARIGNRLILATGCDFHLSPENLDALRADAPRFCINQHDFLLVEFNEFSIPPSMDQTLHEIQLLGLRPVITHPERNAILRLQTARLAKWVRLGCFIQVTAGSLTGVFGSGAQKDAFRWLADGLVHIVASDAHNTREPLKLQPALSWSVNSLAKKRPALSSSKILAAFEGRDLPYVPSLPDEASAPRANDFLLLNC
jgi:protein-tyrosine phosphatase